MGKVLYTVEQANKQKELRRKLEYRKESYSKSLYSVPISLGYLPVFYKSKGNMKFELRQVIFRRTQEHVTKWGEEQLAKIEAMLNIYCAKKTYEALKLNFDEITEMPEPSEEDKLIGTWFNTMICKRVPTPTPISYEHFQSKIISILGGNKDVKGYTSMLKENYDIFSEQNKKVANFLLANFEKTINDIKDGKKDLHKMHDFAINGINTGVVV